MYAGVYAGVYDGVYMMVCMPVLDSYMPVMDATKHHI
jgi:hypothetical protein